MTTMHVPVLASTDHAAAADALASADHIFIGAGAGLSAAAGYDYTDRERFAELFPALHRAGFNARYELMGYPLPPRMQWGFWAAHVDDIRFGTEPSPLYQSLRRAVGDRPHFVMCSNVDALFVRNGFDTEQVFTPQGDYALYQCHTPCTRDVWDSRPILTRALASLNEASGETAEEDVPSCPNCGGDVYLNVNGGRFYIADHFWPTGEKMNDWLRATLSRAQRGERLVVLDIGSGFNTPSVVRWPTEQITRAIPDAVLIRLNRDHPEVPADLAERSYSLADDATEVIDAFASAAPPTA